MTQPTDLTGSLDDLLRSGGDHRLLAADEGLSRYRVSVRPRPTVPFGSCTASSPTDASYRAAQALLERLRASMDPEAALEGAADAIRRRLRSLFELEEGPAIALAPSGTDVLYLLSSLVLRGDSAPVRHVVVGASELGGGTQRACRGLSISDVGPFGPSAVGAPVEGLADRCSAEPVYLRDEAGHRRAPDEVDADVAERVGRAVVDHRVVVHLVAHSKTGLRAPSARCCVELVERYGDRVHVVVDAAQGRLAPRDVRQSLEYGFSVLFTGSKFYGGPPFSGALLLPASYSGDPGALPAGLNDWFARADLPRPWIDARASLGRMANPGMLLRWESALQGIEAYHDTEPRFRAGVYHAFAGAAHEVLGPSQVLILDEPRPPMHELVTALGAYPSVFGFVVMGPDGPLNADSLRVLHAWLDRRTGPDGAPCEAYHLGQPVALGPPQDERPAVLRVALGAQLVTQLAGTPDSGGAWLRATLHAMRAKAEALVHSGVLESSDAPA